MEIERPLHPHILSQLSGQAGAIQKHEKILTEILYSINPLTNNCKLLKAVLRKIFHHRVCGKDIDHRLLQGTHSVAEFAIEICTLAVASYCPKSCFPSSSVTYAEG